MKKCETCGAMPELSRTEQQVYELVLLGWSNQEIADKLFVTVSSVKGHITNLLRKSKRKTRSRMIAEYYLDREQEMKSKLPKGIV